MDGIKQWELSSLCRFEQSEEMLYSKLDNAESIIADLEEKVRKSMDEEKTMRFQLEDVNYSEVLSYKSH